MDFVSGMVAHDQDKSTITSMDVLCGHCGGVLEFSDPMCVRDTTP